MIGKNYSNTGHHNQAQQQRRNAMLNRISSELEHTFRARIDISIHPLVSFIEKNEHHTLDFVIFHPNGVILIDYAPDFAETFRSNSARQVCLKPSDDPQGKSEFQMTPLIKLRRKEWIIKLAKLPDHADNPILRLLIQRADETWHQIVVADKLTPLMAENMLNNIQVLATPKGLAAAITQLILKDDHTRVANPFVSTKNVDKAKLLEQLKLNKQRAKPKQQQSQTPKPTQQPNHQYRRPGIFSYTGQSSKPVQATASTRNAPTNKTRDIKKPLAASPLDQFIQTLINSNPPTRMQKAAQRKYNQTTNHNDNMICCKKCGAHNQLILGHGKFGYYVTCSICETNTVVRFPCPTCGNHRQGNG